MSRMIDHIQGTVTSIIPDRIIVSAGPVGFALVVPQSTQPVVGQSIILYIYLHWNQEQGPTFFGFFNEIERQLFCLMIGCSGIGPKIALAILGHMTPAQFVHAIKTEDENVLSSINGIGSKKAEHIIVQLKHKIAKHIELSGYADQTDALQKRNELTQVLASLHYSKQEIHNTLAHLQEQHEIALLPFDQLMRYALAFLAKRV